MEKMARAPYSFVPFSDCAPFFRYKSIEELPPQNRLDPALHTGEIHITLCARTPVFVSDGSGRFFCSDGQPAIPGSTVRGLIRENMQILGFGNFRPKKDFCDRRLFYRVIAGGKKDKDSNQEAVNKVLERHYRDALDIVMEDGKPVPRAVKAGYVENIRGKEYCIHPVPVFYSLSRSSTMVRNIIDEMSAFKQRRPQTTSLPGRDRVFPNAFYQPVWYTCADNRIQSLEWDRKLVDPRNASCVSRKMEHGWILFPGRSIKGPGTCYVIPDPSPKAAPIPLSFDDALALEQDWDFRKTVLQNRDFWKLPRKYQQHPVFYTQMEYMKNGKQEHHTYLSLSRFPRIGYRGSLGQGLPDNIKYHLHVPDALDYPGAILGFQESGQDKRQKGSLGCRSRVSFEDLILEGTPRKMSPFSLIAAAPKPSYYPGYVEKGKHYDSETFRLRGYKQYWLKEFAMPVQDPGKANAKSSSSMSPLQAGSSFRGVIRYNNLTGDELGLLLWSLRLEPGCFQPIGMGKPLGMGCMQLTIDRMLEYDPAELYRDFCAEGREISTARMDACIAAYQSYVSEALDLAEKSVGQLEELQDFFYIRSRIMPASAVSYMNVTEYKDIQRVMPTIRDFRTGKL